MSSNRSSQWQVLRSKYVTGLKQRVQQIAEVWQHCLSTPSKQNLEALGALTHRLVGSGEAYGFPEISNSARAFDKEIKLILSLPNPDPVSLRWLYDDLIVCLTRSSSSHESRNRLPQQQIFNPNPTSLPAIVLAEDDADFGQELVRVLSAAQFQVHWIEHIQDLPSAVMQYHPVAAIIDMIFPEGRFAGAESVLQLRKQPGPPLPIIFMSACDDFDIRLASVRAGGSHFFVKPLKNDQLVQTLRALVGIEEAEPYRVLLIDDDQTLLDLYREVLSEAGFRVFCADHATAGIESLLRDDPELVLLDLNMPDCNGLELGQIIRQHQHFASTPILFMSTETNSDVQMACARLAGDEFITKPIEPWRLLMAVESRVKRSRMLRREMQRHAGHLPMQVDHDILTALPNLRQLKAELNRRLPALSESNQIALMKLDLDDFHQINDLYGQVTGDRLIQRLAWTISHQLTHHDLLFRDSGDEFWILQSNVKDISLVGETADAILGAVRQTCQIDGKSLTMTASIGITLAPQDGRQVEELLKCADTALFHSKRKAGGTYCYFATRMQQDLLRQFTVEQELRQAIEGKQFVVYYQPIIDVASGNLKGFEALVRWQHPSRGIIAPQEFISIVETRGMAQDLTRQILRDALTCLHNWRQKLPELFVSVNLTAADAQGANLVAEIHEMLRNSNLDPNGLVLELTESVLISDWETGGANLQALSDLGVRLAIDDFGTGYSSLSYLNRFPVDKLKIDRSFVSNWSHRQDDRLIRAIILLGSNLNLCVVAEGVEQPEQLQFLKTLGCQEFQGFLVSTPQPIEEIEKTNWFKTGFWALEPC